MLYSKDLSLTSLCIGIIASVSLIFFGNKKSLSSNKAIGYYFLFITLMQVVEYLLWLDIECVNGLNETGALLGPILNHTQPIILFLLTYIYLDSTNTFPINAVISANILYFIYICHQYYKYISDSSNLCIKRDKHGYLNNTWKPDFSYVLYLLITYINLSNHYNNINLMIACTISHLLLIITIFNVEKNIDEYWFLIATGVPFANLLAETIFSIDN